MGWWNDNLARINGNGALTLGQTADDGNGDATYPYAKGDVWVNIPLLTCPTAAATTGTWVVPTMEARAANSTAGRQGMNIKLAGANALNAVLVPISQALRTAGATSGNVNKGFLAKQLDIVFNPITTTLNTVLTVTAWTRLLANSVAEDGVAYGGTITYQNPIGTTVTNLPSTANATGNWVCAAVFGTPSWINVYDTDLFAELVCGLNTPTCSIRILDLNVRGSWAML
jgi:hypothetical protein